MAAFSVGPSAKLVMRFGIKPPLTAGLLFAGAGLLLFSRAPVDGSFLIDVAVLASLAAARTSDALAVGQQRIVALNSGYHAALLAGGAFAILAAILGATLLRVGSQTPAHEHDGAVGIMAGAEADRR